MHNNQFSAHITTPFAPQQKPKALGRMFAAVLKEAEGSDSD